MEGRTFTMGCVQTVSDCTAFTALDGKHGWKAKRLRFGHVRLQGAYCFPVTLYRVLPTELRLVSPVSSNPFRTQPVIAMSCAR